tara:strand:+ start:464 stop:760 length:297 start_codon:yes stop_codon:yes gene_type:complete
MVIGLLFSGNGHAEKLDEYECYHSDGSGPAFFALADDYIINFYLKSNASKLKKINETEEKIIFGDKFKEIVFYKRTYKILDKYFITEKVYIMTCEKLN